MEEIVSLELSPIDNNLERSVAPWTSKQKIVHEMDSKKSQQALMPAKSIFKDVALAIGDREIPRNLSKGQHLSVELPLLSHEISKKPQFYRADGRLGILFRILSN